MPDAGKVPGMPTHRPMRVLHVIDSLGAGGAERALVTLCAGLKAQGVHPEVAVLFKPHTLGQELQDAGVPVHDLAIPHRWCALTAIWRLRRLVRRQAYDLVHTHLFFASLYTGLAWRRGAPPRVVLFHNLGYEAHPVQGLARRLRRAVEAVTLRRRFAVHAGVSEAVAAHYQAELRLPPVLVVPNPVPLPGILLPPVDVRARFGLPGKGRLGVIAGRLSAEKGHDVLLHALAQPGLPPAAWAVAGEGPLRRELEALARRCGVAGYLYFLGELGHADLLALMAAADVVVVPSRSEGMGLVAVEAMRLGRCVVASRTGGLAEVVRHGVTGLLVEPGSPSELADALRTALNDDKLRRRLGAAAQQEGDAFNPGVVVSRWLDIYGKAFASRGRQRA